MRALLAARSGCTRCARDLRVLGRKEVPSPGRNLAIVAGYTVMFYVIVAKLNAGPASA